MNKIIVCLLGIIFSTQVMAQSKEEKEITAAVENMRSAMIDGDRTRLDALADDKLTYGHSGGKVQNKQEFVDDIVAGKSDFVTIDLTEQTIIVSGNTAIVRHILHAKTNDSGKPGEVTLRIMLVFQKNKNAWKLLARQAVKYMP